MDNRNSIITIFKTTNPAKIIVFFASSLPNEIRFYLNDTYYLTAIECEDGFAIRIGEKKKEIKQQKKFSIRKFSKKRILLFFIIIGVATLFFLESLRIANNILFFLIVTHFIIFLVKLASVLGTSAIENSQRKKSKHSAEHMMVNFIENNQRLPKNIEEVKNSSRFSHKCGSIALVKDISEDFIKNIVAIIFTVIICKIILHSSYSVKFVIFFLLIYGLMHFIVRDAIKKYDALKFIINPVNKVLSYLVQCTNTTKKVLDKDIISAYWVAKKWLQIVYPQFYNKNEDILWKEYLKMNNIKMSIEVFSE